MVICGHYCSRREAIAAPKWKSGGIGFQGMVFPGTKFGISRSWMLVEFNEVTSIRKPYSF